MDRICIDGEILYIEGLHDLDGNRYRDDSIKDFLNIESLKNALNPVVKVGKIIKQGMLELAPNEVEVTLQLQLGISGEKLAFALVNAEAQAHLSVKYVWKDENNSP